MSKTRQKRGRGRPTHFRKEYVERAFRLCAQGATDLDLAEAFKVVPSALYVWKKKHPEFAEAAAAGKKMVDQRVEKCLLMRALGEWQTPAVKIFNDEGAPLIVPYLERYPPDVGACLNWLKNRDPERWRDRHELTGANGGPIRIEQLTDAELERIVAGK